MSRRIPLIVAVVGALLVGGATTGTTRASWTGQRTLTATVGSATMGSATVSAPSTLTVNKGTTGTSVLTITDTSSAGARNLVQRLTPSITGPVPPGITASVTSRSSGTCSASAQGPVTTTPGSAVTACLRVSVPGSTAGTNTTISVTVAGRQLRGGSPVGWTAPNQTLTVPVVLAPLLTPVVSCVGANANGFTWGDVPGATEYVLSMSDTPNGPYTDQPKQTDRSYYYPSGGGSASRYWRVRAVNGANTSAVSNTVLMTRSGSSYTCQGVTP